MKNFDEDRTERRRTLEERTFQIGGETFVLRTAIKPEWMVPYEDLDIELHSSEHFLQVIDDLIRHCIEPIDDAAARYTNLRSRADDPVDMVDLQNLVKWVIETGTGRPTGQRDGSSPSRTTTGTGSTAEPSSPDSVAA